MYSLFISLFLKTVLTVESLHSKVGNFGFLARARISPGGAKVWERNTERVFERTQRYFWKVK